MHSFKAVRHLARGERPAQTQVGQARAASDATVDRLQGTLAAGKQTVTPHPSAPPVFAPSDGRSLLAAGTVAKTRPQAKAQPLQPLAGPHYDAPPRESPRSSRQGRGRGHILQIMLPEGQSIHGNPKPRLASGVLDSFPPLLPWGRRTVGTPVSALLRSLG